MTKRFILTDDDTDGVMSAHLLWNAVCNEEKDENVLVFQKWNIFGVTEEDALRMAKEFPNEIYILDVGSGVEVLEKAERLLEDGKRDGRKLFIYDNHPPSADIIGLAGYGAWEAKLEGMLNKWEGYFTYRSTTENCTTGIIYDQYRSKLKDEKINKLWTLIGLTGDVAASLGKDWVLRGGSEGKAIFEECIKEYPNLVRKFYFGKYADFEWGNLDFMANFFHNPRRIIFDEAPLLCFKSTIEIEAGAVDFGDGWLDLYKMGEGLLLGDDKVKELKAEYEKKAPETMRILDLYVQWKDWKKAVDKRGQIITFDYPHFGVSLIAHPWNLGSALASVKAKDMYKAHFVVNHMPDKNMIHVAGRSPDVGDAPISGVLNIGKVFHNADQSILKGGGFKPAGSAYAQVEDDSIIIDALYRAVEASLAHEQSASSSSSTSNLSHPQSDSVSPLSQSE